MDNQVIIRDTRLGKTRTDIFRMADTELNELQRGLVQHVGTPQEFEAKQLNRWIQWEKDRRCSYGF